jgi:hypothetical protein
MDNTLNKIAYPYVEEVTFTKGDKRFGLAHRRSLRAERPTALSKKHEQFSP